MRFWEQVGSICLGSLVVGSIFVVWCRIKDGRFTLPLTTAITVMAFIGLIVSFIQWRKYR